MSDPKDDLESPSIDDDFELVDDERQPVRTDDKTPSEWDDASITDSLAETPDEEIERMRAHQAKKSALFFGSVDQSSFYKALERDRNFQILHKFQQSGLSGFLPFSDPGVCDYMSRDFARAVTEGRYQEWRNHVVAKDDMLIERFRAGQHNLNTRQIQEMERRQFTEAHEQLSQQQNRDNERYSMIADRQKLATRIGAVFDKNKFNHAQSSLHTPCVYFRVSIERTGLFGKGKRFGHAMMFTMATTDDHKLDPDHLFFMDPNAGIIKIKNTPESINAFIENIDNKLLGELKINQFAAIELERTWLPSTKSEKWEALEHSIVSGNPPKDPNNYALSELCLIDDYLRNQIERLASDHSNEMNWFYSLFVQHSDKKIEQLMLYRDELRQMLIDAQQIPNPEIRQQFLQTKQEELLTKIDKCVSEKRHRFAIGESTSKKKFTDLKERLNKITHPLRPQQQTDALGDGEEADKDENKFMK